MTTGLPPARKWTAFFRSNRFQVEVAAVEDLHDGTPPQVPYTYDTVQTVCLTQVHAVGMWYTNFTQYNPGCQVAENQQVAYTFEYTYNLSGAFTKEKYPSGREVVMEYDTAGRPSAICNGPCANNDPYVDSFSFGAYGLPLSSTLGNGVPETIGYNNLLQITYIQAGSSGSLFDLANGYSSGSNNGNIVSQTINGSVSRSFLYDGLNRLTEAAQSSSWTEGYSYDRFGNRAVTTRTSPLPGLTGETPDQLTDYNTSNNRISVFTYDARGNIAATPAWTANYDGENRQISVMPTGGSGTWYGYDASNRRVLKTDGTNGPLYFYDAFGRLAVEDDGTTTIEYIAGSKVVENSSTGRQYYIKDHLGSILLITNGGGSAVSGHDYLPFGEELGGSGCATLMGGVRFTGQYRDQESCLDYFVNRYMSPAQGRFTSPDRPFADQHARDPQSWNLYAYVGNNPLIRIDPQGTAWWSPSFMAFDFVGDLFASGGFSVSLPALPPDTWSKIGHTITNSLDHVQMGLAVAGMIPGIGEVADLVDAGISLARGDLVGAGLSAASMIPFAGNATGAANIARIGNKIANKADTAESLYHYTNAANVDNILEGGLLPGQSGKIFTTPDGSLTPTQAQIDLALSPNRGMPNSVIEIDGGALRNLGIKPISGPSVVHGTANAAGGGLEVIFDQPIPPTALRRR